MKATFGVAAVFALAIQQSAATSWGSNKYFPNPRNSDNICSDNQKGGYTWKDLNPGSFDAFDDFDFSGFTCRDDSRGRMKRTYGSGFGSKCIEGNISKGSNRPAITCKKPEKGFSITSFDITVEKDTDVRFTYHMPDGSKCKHTSPCQRGGSVIKNTHCGGAKSVDFELPTHSKHDKCDFRIHKIDFDCKPPETPQKPPKYPTGGVPIITDTQPTETTPAQETTPAEETTPAQETESTAQPTESSPGQVTTPTEDNTTPPVSYTTSTIYTTEVETITSCAPEVPSCPADSTVVVTSTIPISTTVCPVTETSPPEQTPPADGTPTDGYPDETNPGENTPSETAPAETTPTGASPDESTPGDNIPSETAPAQTTPTGATPGETYPGNKIPSETIPGETTPTGASPDETTPGDNVPSETVPGETTPTGASPDETTPGETVPGETTPGAVTPTQSAPSGVVVTEVTYTTLTTCPVTTTITSGTDEITVTTSTVSTLTQTSIVTICPGPECTQTVPGGPSPPFPTATKTDAGPSEPIPSADCPGVVPECINTWLNLVPDCDSNSDASCFCPSKEFTESVIECIQAWGASDQEVSDALSYLTGICAADIPKNPGIITAVPSTITLAPPAPTGDNNVVPPYTTITVSQVVTESGAENTITKQITVPQVEFVTAAPTAGTDGPIVDLIPAPTAAPVQATNVPVGPGNTQAPLPGSPTGAPTGSPIPFDGKASSISLGSTLWLLTGIALVSLMN
ncbi:hypothetical protein AJ80_08048 [Polytolypa hystricis UAMH7299]|uniref:CFEM domain-containing protein n=1 Tax=Polytolypa hystricis (strain UAMH7299) TaxID=1447883 RepID=A0A2B7XEC6_POLH7|nr:hypothetical protein AJ80_08048 [Polytolypa hystricis UAMH7299]